MRKVSRLTIVFIVLMMSIIIFGCKSPISNIEPNKKQIVYIAGEEYLDFNGNRGFFMKNGEKKYLDVNQLGNSFVNDIKYFNGDLYTVGGLYDSNHPITKAAYWVNSKLKIVDSSDKKSEINKISFYNNKPIFVGVVKTSYGGSTLNLWYNGTNIESNINDSSLIINDTYIHKDKLYISAICGHDVLKKPLLIVYDFKDGSFVDKELLDYDMYNDLGEIFCKNGYLYIPGSYTNDEQGIGTYWKYDIKNKGIIQKHDMDVPGKSFDKVSFIDGKLVFLGTDNGEIFINGKSYQKNIKLPKFNSRFYNYYYKFNQLHFCAIDHEPNMTPKYIYFNGNTSIEYEMEKNKEYSYSKAFIRVVYE